MNILGISCLYHDAAAALLRDGELVGAADEERFTRKRHDPDIPRQAVAYCLAEAGIGIDEVDYLVFYDKPGHGQSSKLKSGDYDIEALGK